MKFARFVFLLAVLLASGKAALAATVVPSGSGDYVEGELLVKFKNGVISSEAQLANARTGAKVVAEFSELGWQLVRLPEGVSTADGLAQYQNFRSFVEYVQPNYIYKLTATPNDTRYFELYGMQKIGAPAAWDITTGSSNVIVAVIDTGVKYTHEDLAANMWQNPGEIAGNNVDDDGNGFVDDIVGYDFINNDADPNDDYNHGTHVAGTIGGVGNNGKGVAGVNWNVRMMALKIHDSAGNSTAATLMRAFQYVRTMRLRGVNIRVTNNSYAGCPEACGYDQATKDAIDAAGELDILNVFAAGNNSRNIETTPSYPASYNSPSILSVASSDQNDNRSGFSNFGATSVDLAAPGTGILSAVNGSNSSYAFFNGTSMAAPHVSGAAALLLAANPNLSAASLKATLMNRVDALSQWNGIVKTGGRLNVASAIQNQTVCSFNLSATNIGFQAPGGNGSVNVTAPVNCDFSVVSQTNWITITAGNPGSGNTTVNFTVLSNSGAARQGIIRIAGQNVIVNQLGADRFPNPAGILDFDGDRRTDFSVIQNLNGTMIWHNQNSTSGYEAKTFGLFTDTAVPADYDGDGKWDVAVWRGGANAGDPAYFYVLNGSNNTFRAVQWGISSDSPRIAQDFDGDGKADFAVTRKFDGRLFWYILQSSSNAFRAVQFGFDTDLPVRGDFDGDAKADVAVYRPAAGNPSNTFFVLKSTDGGLLARTFGDSTIDKIVQGDFDGDGKTDFAVWRTTNGVWYWLESAAGTFRAQHFGQNGDLPAAGDFDGDGKTDVAVWRPNTLPNEPGYFYVNRSSTGFTAFGWGNNQMRVTAAGL